MSTDATRARRHATDADRRLITAAGDHLGVLARTGAAVMNARRTDLDLYPAAHEVLADVCQSLTGHFAKNPCELYQFLRLVGTETGSRGFTGYPTTNSPEGI